MSFQEKDIDTIFFSEVGELLISASNTLIAAEENDRVIEAIPEMFRVFHSLKSGAQSMKLSLLAELAHRMEDLLDSLRKGILTPDSQMVSLILAAADLMEKELKAYKSGEDLLVLGFRQESLLKLVDEIQQGRAVIQSEGFAEAAATAKQGCIQQLLQVFCTFRPASVMLQASQYLLLHRLQEIGSVLYSIPSEPELLSNDCYKKRRKMMVVIKTSLSEAELKEHCELTDLLQVHVIKLTNSAAQVHREISSEQQPELYLSWPQSELAVTTNNGKDLARSEGKSAAESQKVTMAGREDIRVDLDKLDLLLDYVGELVVAEAVVVNHPDVQAVKTNNFKKEAARFNKIVRDIQDVALSMRMVPLSGTFLKMARLVRDVALQQGKKVNLQIMGEDTEVDRSIIEQITDPLLHLIRNAVDHGIESVEERRAAQKAETGKITLEARQVDGEIWIMVKDDGRGLNRTKIVTKAQELGLIDSDCHDWQDEEVWQLIFEPGLSTATTVTELSGRGVGMDIVKRNIDRSHGRIDVHSTFGLGCLMVIRVLQTLSLLEVIIVRVGKVMYSIPIMSIKESLRLREEQIASTPEGFTVADVRGRLLPILRLSEFYNIESDSAKLTDGILVIAEAQKKQCGLFVDELVGSQRIVRKALPEYLSAVRGAAGFAVLGGGETSMILDIFSLIQAAGTVSERSAGFETVKLRGGCCHGDK